MINRYRLLLGSALLLFASWAQAACTLPAASAALGSSGSFAVNTSVLTSSSAINVNCGSGTVASLLSTNTISLQLTGATTVSGSRAVLKSASAGDDAIPVQLCTSELCTTELAVNGTKVSYSSSELLNLIGLLGNLNFTLPLYIRTLTGANVRAGTYSTVMNVTTTYSICTGLSAVGLCLLANNQSGTQVVPLTVTLTVTNDCLTITADNANFSSASFVSDFSTITGNIKVSCTKESSYTVGLSDGGHLVNGVRNMASSDGLNLLSYQLYKPGGTARWGSSVASERVASSLSSSVSSDGITRNFIYVAKILTTQATPPVGEYSDNVIIDLSF